jgi:hypothetical protein
MKAFSYTKTPYLLDQIEKTEDLRKTLLLTPLSLKDSSYFRWRALVDRIHYSFLLKGTVRDKKAIEELLHPHSLTHTTSIQKEMIRFKKTIDYTYYNWLVTNNPISLQSLQEVYSQLYGEKLRIDDSELHYNLRYIQTNPDNPLIQAGLAYVIFLSHGQIVKEAPLLSYVVPLMFLYKAGYDYRQFLVLEEYFAAHSDRFHMLIAQSVRDSNVTGWLEFIVEATEYQLNKILKYVSSKDFNMESSQAILDLNERQKAILASLDEPGSKISNKIIQKNYRISPITAARDLAKLSNLGFLFPIGRGRSTYYTKV